MRLFVRFTALLLTAVLLLGILPVSAEESEWLIPKMCEAPAFTDTAGTICADAARICCEAGLMTGVDAKHFMPETGLSNAQIIVISARLHRLLKTGTVGEFDSYHLPKDQWWNPYDKYLREQIPELTKEEKYNSMCEEPSHPCYRETFLRMLAAVLNSAGTSLPEINDVDAVPDCKDPEIMWFYRVGILGGKDAYGSLINGPLSRAAAAAMLARLIDPAQRLHLNLQTLDLCRELLELEPDAPLMEIAGRTITAQQFVVPYAEDVFYYDHSHFAAMTLEMNGGWEGQDAVDKMVRFIQAELLAEERNIPMPESENMFYDGVRGLTAAGQKWNEEHEALLKTLEGETLPDAPEIHYTENWNPDRFRQLSSQMYYMPGWIYSL